MSAAFTRKLSSLLKYRNTFIDWPRAATMRYRERQHAEPVRLRLRGGGALWVRPRFDTVAMGELFVAESYGELLPAHPIRTVWDIGGNIGCFAIWLLRRQPDARITSFEPCAETFAVLSKNRDEFSGRAWQIRPFGLSDRDQTVEAFVPFDSYGQTSRHAEAGIATQLPLRAMAEVWQAEGRPALDLLKIDCEGDEYEILASMPDAMWAAVRSILLEIHPRKDRQPGELRERLAARGFRLRTGTVNPDLWLATRD
jgi:FkbM family methyltransferase